ncbi:hypothetical protein PENTCL1PPCAC_16853, partial [Pristionchus entomophagus]
KYISASFTSSFTVPFSLMNIHFLYRPTKITLFSDIRVIALLVAYPTVQVMIWMILSIEFTAVDDFEALEIVRNGMKEQYNLTK